MKILSLFSGIGGIDLGLERAGMTTVGQVEIDPFCNLVLEKHWPDVPRWPDVRTVSAESVRERCGDIDLIAGGFPCQPHSVAGKRKGQQDDRHLWTEFARLVRELRPRWVLAENVPGIRSTAADEVIGDLEAAGYAVWPLVVGADDVGAPHRRKRVWFVAHRTDDHRRAGERGAEAGVRQNGERGRRSTGGGDLVHSAGLRLEGHRPDAGQPAQSEPRDASTRWPSRPGEPQHEWEEPRLAYAALSSTARLGLDGRNQRDETIRPTESSSSKQGAWSPQLPLGSSTDGLSLRLVRRINRESLKAYGNSVVPQVVEIIGRAIMQVEAEEVERG